MLLRVSLGAFSLGRGEQCTGEACEDGEAAGRYLRTMEVGQVVRLL